MNILLRYLKILNNVTSCNSLVEAKQNIIDKIYIPFKTPIPNMVVKTLENM
jgi:hypothetical protein